MFCSLYQPVDDADRIVALQQHVFGSVERTVTNIRRESAYCLLIELDRMPY